MTVPELQNQQTGQLKNDGAEHWFPAGQSDPALKAAVCEDLDNLGRLEANWDQFGAPCIDPEVIEAAKHLIKALPENLAFRPHVVPVPNGTVQIEWHGGPKTLELEFEDSETIRYLRWNPAQGIEEEGCVAAGDVAKVVELIRWFMSGLCV